MLLKKKRCISQKNLEKKKKTALTYRLTSSNENKEEEAQRS